MKVLLLQLDGKIPNIALMRIARHHRLMGDEISFRFAGNELAIQPMLWESPDWIYASLIFARTRPLAARLWDSCRTKLLLGGTGWDIPRKLEDVGISTLEQDYSIYPRFRQSIGFTQRGCRLNCEFCLVPKKEGKIKPEKTVWEIWRGDPWPRELLLLDNDFFGQPDWRKRITEIRDGGFKVSFNQGINARCLTEEAAEAIASVNYRDDSMKTKRIYTAWDSREDEERLFAGLNRLVKYGVKPDHIMVYMLVGYWPNETAADREYRLLKLRQFGARPYPMPYERTPELRGFQRWIVGAYDKRIPWTAWPSCKLPSRESMTGRGLDLRIGEESKK